MVKNLPLLHGNKMKEKDTKKEKLIYYDFRRFRDLVRNNYFIDSK